MNVEKTVVQCIKKIVFTNKKITMDTTLVNELQMDSMLLVSLGMLLEEKTGVSIIVFSENMDFISDIKVNQIVELIKDNLPGGR